MRYEKKMLILSGDGKGVVLVEKSGLGVRFALRTFGLPKRPDLKAGVVTKTDVFVRDLPYIDNPSAVFYLDGVDIDGLHFAVFDSELRLYGTTCERMWESNLMGLLKKRAAPVALERGPYRAELPPLVKKPAVLPLPDGTGIPQSRDAIYGDDALAESDFYTPFDLSSRMKAVDGFLDTPRILDGLSPTVETRKNRSRTDNPSMPPSAYSVSNAENITVDKTATAAADKTEVIGTTDTAEVGTTETENAAAVAENPDTADVAENPDTADVAENPDTADTEVVADGETAQAETDGEDVVADETTDADATTAADTAENSDTADTDPIDIMECIMQSDERAQEEDETALYEAAATADMYMPWQYEAQYLCKMSHRAPIEFKSEIEPVKASDKVKHLRETDFFERCKSDIDRLFASAERDGELSALLPDIEWVKVEFDGHVVSVGRTKVFLCYAVAGVYEKVSPLGDETQWLPRLKNAPTGRGYWLIFQDIMTGDIIRACQ